MDSIKMTPDNDKKYKTLFNYLSTKYGVDKVNKDSYINDYKTTLMNEINDNSKWKNGTKESYYFMISKWLSLNTSDEEYIKIFREKGHDILVENRKIINENKLDEKEKENYRDIKYFEDILKDESKKGTTLTSHYEYLLLACVIWNPPLRTDFYRSATYIKGLTENDFKNNFVHVDEDKNVVFVVNKDKSSNYKVYKENKSLSLIIVNDNRLCDLLSESFLKYPRKFLFENEKTKKPFSQNTLLGYLRNITGLEGINDQMMRSIYITNFYKTPKTYQQKLMLAYSMRHSIDTAQQNYLKVLDDEPTEDTPFDELRLFINNNKELKETIRDLINDNNMPLILDPLKITPTEDEPIEIEDTKTFSKRRKDMLYRYNKKNVKPSDKTMNKYNIKYDIENKKYI